MNESASDSRLDHLLAEYLRRIDRGESVSLETLQREQPEHADELLELIETAQLINELAGPTLAEESGVVVPPTELGPDESTLSPAEVAQSEPQDVSAELEPTVVERPKSDPMGATNAMHTRVSSPPSFDEADQLLGARIDDYQILSVLGKGGMGVVYKARQVSVDRMVAIKMILGGRFATEEDVQRFYIEAQAAAKAKHPNIVNVYEVGQCEGRMFFSMEFVDGVNLAELAEEEGALPGKRAAEYMKQVAEAMQDAHEAGVLHRDLKPANVLIDRKDRPRVTDFGLAKHLDEDSGLTASGAAVGTPSYMSPEQASGRHDLTSARTDVYALGAVLYVMLTGKPPFRANTPLQTIMHVINLEPTPPDQLNPDVDPDLQTICLKCLEKDPSNRFASAAELAEELDRYLTGRPILSKPRGRLERMRLWLLNVPLIAAACGRPVIHAAPAHQRFQAGMMLAVLLVPLISYFSLTVWRQTLPRRIVIAAGPSGGAYHGIASLLQEPIAEATRRKVIVHPSGGSAENYQLLESGRSHLAFLQAADLADLKSELVVIVAPVYYEAIHIIVRKNAGIATIKDLEGRNVSLGATQGSSMHSSAKMLLEYYKLPIDSLKHQDLSYTQLLEDSPDVPGLDAAIVTIGLGSDTIKEILSNGEFELLELANTEEFYHPTLRSFPIEKGAYGPGVPPQRIHTFATPAFLATRKWAPNSLVEAALKAVYAKPIPGGVSRSDAAGWPGLALHKVAQDYYERDPEATAP